MTVEARATLLDQLQSDGVALPRVMSVHPVVADTAALVSDVMMSVCHETPSLLLLAMRIGVVRCFVAHHVWAEVPRTLAAIGDDGRLDFLQAEQLWWGSYVPLIRVVDTATLPRAMGGDALLDRDRSDGPTALLHGLIAPVVSLSTDKDLVDLGLASDDWRLVIRSSREIAEAAQMAFGANTALNLTAVGAAGAARTGRRLLSEPWVQALAVLLVAGLFLTRERWMPPASDRARRIRDSAPELGQRLADGLGDRLQRLDVAYEAWDRSMTGQHGGAALHDVARLLAVSSPMTAEEIAKALAPGDSRGKVREGLPALRHALRSGSGFVEVRRGRWQLGRSGSSIGPIPHGG